MEALPRARRAVILRQMPRYAMPSAASTSAVAPQRQYARCHHQTKRRFADDRHASLRYYAHGMACMPRCVQRLVFAAREMPCPHAAIARMLRASIRMSQHAAV